MSPIMAVLLAITMAIFPVAMPRAAGPGLSDGTVQSAHHPHEAYAQGAAGHHHGDPALSPDHAAADADCAGTGSGAHHGDDDDCCKMGACHALQVGMAPSFSFPSRTTAAVGLMGDEQVDGIISGRLDRPPRRA